MVNIFKRVMNMRRIYILVFIFIMSSTCCYAEGNALSAAEMFVRDLSKWFLGLSGASLTVGLGSAAFMKHFSGEDPELAAKSKKLARGSIQVFGILAASSLIAATIQKYVM